MKTRIMIALLILAAIAGTMFLTPVLTRRIAAYDEQRQTQPVEFELPDIHIEK